MIRLIWSQLRVIRSSAVSIVSRPGPPNITVPPNSYSRIMSKRLLSDQSHPLDIPMNTIITQFFASGRSGGQVGELFEKNIADTLTRSGYQRFPLSHLDGTPNLVLGVGKELFGGDKPKYPTGEIDSLVNGNSDSLKRLMFLCPEHNVDPRLKEAEDHILICEAKSSSKEAIKSLSTSSHDVNLDHWLFKSCSKLVHKVLFVNGGEDSKEWVLRGHQSTNRSDRNVWNALAAANASIFYRESFTQEWVIQMSTSLDETKVKLEATSKSLDETNVTLDETNAKLDETNVTLDETKVKLDKVLENETSLSRKIFELENLIKQFADKIN